MWLDCKVIKKSGNPPFLHQPPFSGLSPLSSKKCQTPLSDSIFGRSYPPTPFKKGGGGSNYHGGQFFLALEVLNFHLPWEGLAKWGFKIFDTLGEGVGSRVFSAGWGGESLPHWLKIYSSLPDQEKSPPVDSSHQIFIPPPKVNSPSLSDSSILMLKPNKNFIVGCIRCSCTGFIINSYSLYT